MSERIDTEVEYTDLRNDDGQMVPGVVVTCTECQHQTESFGTSSASVRRCLALLREECPQDENNFYYSEDAED